MSSEKTISKVDQLRSDFKTVWMFWRNSGCLSQQEHDDGRNEWAAEIRNHMADKEWIECCANHFRQMAADIEQSIARSERIRAEVRAEKDANRVVVRI